MLPCQAVTTEALPALQELRQPFRDVPNGEARGLDFWSPHWPVPRCELPRDRGLRKAEQLPQLRAGPRGDPGVLHQQPHSQCLGPDVGIRLVAQNVHKSGQSGKNVDIPIRL